MPFTLLAITQPEQVAAEPALLVRLFEHGLTVAHLRKPGGTMEEMESYLQQIPPQYHARLVVHSHYELASRYGLKGIHLTEKSRLDSQAATWVRRLQGRSVSTSFHSLTEVARHRRRYHYVFLSPLFDSTSKTDYRSNFRLAEVQRAMQQWQRRRGYVPQVVALGGIGPANLNQVQQAGFAGAAVLGGIWQQPDPVAAFRQLQSEIR